MRSVFLAFALVAAASCGSGGTPSNTGSGGAGTGGAVAMGGAGTGGAVGTGGKTSSGGAPGTGGKTGSGGATSKGGAIGTGGSLPPGTCTDVSSASFTVNTQYGGDYINVDGGSGKSYFMMANWWGKPYNNQSETVSGIGFTMTNPNNVVTSQQDTPMGFPSIYIGAYNGKKTAVSNLPKQVSALTRVPTIFSTNENQKGTSNYNATYDVWFTATNTPLSSGQSSPGSGGAYLMVWLFSPADRRPRSPSGSPTLAGTMIKGIKGGWDVWYDDGKSSTPPQQPCVSYVSNTALSSFEFDLNNFIQDAVTSGTYSITASQYLSVVFAGFEVWGGGDGLKINQFCVNVE